MFFGERSQLQRACGVQWTGHTISEAPEVKPSRGAIKEAAVQQQGALNADTSLPSAAMCEWVRRGLEHTPLQAALPAHAGRDGAQHGAPLGLSGIAALRSDTALARYISRSAVWCTIRAPLDCARRSPWLYESYHAWNDGNVS